MVIIIQIKSSETIMNTALYRNTTLPL